MCRYPLTKEYIALPITDPESLDIAFTMVTPSGNSLELYANANIDNTPRHGVRLSFSGFFPSSSEDNYGEGGTFEQHFDAPFPADTVPTRASDCSGSDDGSNEGFDGGLCNADGLL